MEIICTNDGNNSQICIWKKDPLDTLAKCDKVAYIEQETFLRYSLGPVLKILKKSKTIYHIGREVLNENWFGMTFILILWA